MMTDQKKPEEMADEHLEQARGGVFVPGRTYTIKKAGADAGAADSLPVEDFTMNFEEVKIT